MIPAGQGVVDAAPLKPVADAGPPDPELGPDVSGAGVAAGGSPESEEEDDDEEEEGEEEEEEEEEEAEEEEDVQPLCGANEVLAANHAASTAATHVSLDGHSQHWHCQDQLGDFVPAI